MRWLLLIAALLASAPSLQAQPRKQVLVIFDEDQSAFPGLARIDRSLRDTFGKAVDYHSEAMDLAQFQRPGYDQMLADHYERKYAGKRLDLIVAVLEPPLDFLLQHGAAIFPGVPIVFCGVDASTIAVKKLPRNITGVLVERSFAPTLDIALRLQPDTRRVFVVGGASAFDRYLEALARRDLKGYERRVAVDYLVGLPMEALLKGVSHLPANSVIVFTTLFADGDGRTFIPHEALSAIATSANAPVYAALDQYIGVGAVGGSVYSVDAQGSAAAKVGLEIIGGAAPLSIPMRGVGSQIDMFDARQLARWQLDETRLPAHSEIRYREPSMWHQYRWYVAGTMAIVLLQGALIAGLLLARLRRQKAEAEALRQRGELAHVLRVTTLGELTSSLAHEISQPLSAISMNAQAAHQLLAAGPAETEEVGEALTDIADDAKRAAQIIQRLRALFRKEQVRQIPVDVNALVNDVVGLLHNAMLIRHIDMRLMLGQALPAVVGDPVQLEQVVLNVVMNACEAIEDGEGPRLVTIWTRQARPGWLVLEVVDTGTGVKDGELEHIFEHFITTKPKGLGMGLAISRSIITAHGGRMWASANPDRGLRVHIELPCAPKGVAPGSPTVSHLSV